MARTVSPQTCRSDKCEFECSKHYKVYVKDEMMHLLPKDVPSNCNCVKGSGAVSGKRVDGAFRNDTFSVDPSSDAGTINVARSSNAGVTCKEEYMVNFDFCTL